MKTFIFAILLAFTVSCYIFGIGTTFSHVYGDRPIFSITFTLLIIYYVYLSFDRENYGYGDSRQQGWFSDDTNMQNAWIMDIYYAIRSRFVEKTEEEKEAERKANWLRGIIEEEEKEIEKEEIKKEKPEKIEKIKVRKLTKEEERKNREWLEEQNM